MRCALALVLALFLAGCASAAPLPPKALALNDEGAEALGAGDVEVAEARLALALEYNPRFTEAWVNLGLVKLRQHDYAGARKDFEKAVSLNPDLPAPMHALGILEEVVGEPRKAEARYADALAIDPGFGASRANLGRLLFARGAYEEAREQFLRLVQVAPEQVEGYTGLVDCYWKLGRDAEADAILERAEHRFASVPGVELLLARRAMKRGELDDAEARLVTLTEGQDGRYHAPAWAWLGVARLARGDATGAKAAMDEALARDPNDGVARFLALKLGAK